MEAVKKPTEEERGTLELVLREILEEQQKANKIIDDQVAVINHLTGAVKSFDERLESLKIIGPPISTKPFEEIIKRGITEMQIIANLQPKNVIRKFQILLFPEQDAWLFYKIVFGRWLLLLAFMLFITDLYKWSIHWSDNNKEIRIQEVQNVQFKKAWNDAYLRQNKKGRLIMDSAYNNSYRRR